MRWRAARELGSAGAGEKKGKNSKNNEVLKRHHLWLCTAQKGRDPWRDNQPTSFMEAEVCGSAVLSAHRLLSES